MGDIDGDGTVDLVSASSGDHTIAWYPNIDGKGTFSSVTSVTTTAMGAWDVIVVDIDGDSDLDLASASFVDNTIAWYNNTDGAGTFSNAIVVTSAASGASAVLAVDMDADGDMDLVYTSIDDHTVGWYNNMDGAGTFSLSPIIVSTNTIGASDVTAGDYDTDGDVDLAVASSGDNTVSWFPSSNNGQTFGPRKILAPSVPGARAVVTADIDNDLNPDLVSAASLSIFWYPNTDGLGTFMTALVVTSTADNVQDVAVADIDGDGDLDILSASEADNTVAWHENMDGMGSFGPRLAISTDIAGVSGVAVADIDGDGDLDVASAAARANTVGWYNNTNPPPFFDSSREVTTATPDVSFLLAVDIDNDGDLDLATVSQGGNTLAWFPNEDGFGTFGPQITLSTTMGGAVCVAAADVDNDGDVDLAVAAQGLNSVFIVLNVDGAGSFSDPFVAAQNLRDIRSVALADLDGDGLVDVATASPGDNSLSWFRNQGFASSSIQFSNRITLQSVGAGVTWITAADLDGDGDLDLAAAYSSSSRVAWYENEDGAGTFGLGNLVANMVFGASFVVAADLDGDHALDLVSTSSTGDSVDWYRNTDGLGAFGTRVVITNSAVQASSVLAADLDADGDLDLAISSESTDTIAWISNMDGLGTFGTPISVSTNTMDATLVVAADLDSDGDMDLIAGSTTNNALRWYPRKTRGPFHTYGPSAVHHTPAANLGERGESWPSLARSIGGLSRCSRDTLILPSGDYSCLLDAPFELNFPVRVTAAPGADVVFDCKGGVLFRTLPRDGHLGDLELEGVTVRNTGVARASSVGTPGLRADGNSASLGSARISLINSTVANGVSLSSSRLLAGGFGGCVLVIDGAVVEMINSQVVSCSASEAGGGLAALDSGSQITMSNSSVIGCSSGDSGGGVAIYGGTSLSVSSGSRIEGNSAGSLGGGVAAFSGAGMTVRASYVSSNQATQAGGGMWINGNTNGLVENSVLDGNEAAVGGGLAASLVATGLAVATASSAADVYASQDDSGGLAQPLMLTLTDVKVTGNTATRWGGGVFACDVYMSMGSGVRMMGNEAGRSVVLGSSRDVFVCAAGPGFVVGRDQAAAGGVPWLNVDPGLWDGDGVGEGRGWNVGGPLARLEWVEEPVGRVEAGGVVRGVVKGVDWLGQDVVYDGVTVEVRVEDVDGVLAGVGELPLSLLTTLELELPPVTLGAREGGVGGEVRMEVAVKRDGNGNGESGAENVLELEGVEGRVEVGMCGVGRGGVVEDGVVSCVDCVDGSTSDVVSFEGCVAPGDCPANTARLVGGGGEGRNGSCVCERGFWVPGGEVDVACVGCPRGGVCSGGVVAPVAAPGFYMEEEGGEIVECRRKGRACVGGVRGCGEGYKGYMCNECAEGWYSNAERDCAECEGGAVGVLVGVMVVVVVVGLGVGVGVGVWLRRGGGGGSDGVGVGGGRRRWVPASVGMVLVCVQVVGILADAEFGWGDGARAVLGVGRVANVDVNLFASECSLESFYAKYAVSVLMPLVGIGCVVAGVVGLKMTTGGMEMGVGGLVDAVLFGVAPLLYIPVAKATFVLFDCTRLPNGDLVLDGDPGVPCLDGDWWGVVWVGLVGILYVGGIPMYFLWCLVRVGRKGVLLETETFARYGGLYRLYRVPYYWGGVAELGKRLAVVVAAVFVSEYQLIQIGLLLAIFLGASYVVARLRPYYFVLYNVVDFRLTLILVVLLCLGGASYAEDGASEVLILVGVVSVLVVLAGVAVWAVVVDVLQIKRGREGGYDAAQVRREELAAVLVKEVRDLGGGESEGQVQRLVDVLSGRWSLGVDGGGGGGGGGIGMEEVVGLGHGMSSSS